VLSSRESALYSVKYKFKVFSIENKQYSSRRKDMKPASYKTPVIIALIASLMFLSGCGEGMKASDIYSASLCGALVGGIVGYQSHEEGEGAAIGAAIFGVGELLDQLDNLDGKEKEHKETGDSGRTEIYVIQVHNSNGSITPVEVEKKGDIFIGPKGEQYESLPTEEQLKPVYGF
jgi:hypothetical protein